MENDYSNYIKCHQCRCIGLPVHQEYILIEYECWQKIISYKEVWYFCFRHLIEKTFIMQRV